MSPSRPSSALTAFSMDPVPEAVPSPASARANCSAITPASPGAWRSTAVTSRVSPLARGAISMTGTPSSTAARRHAEVQHRELLPQVGCDQHDRAGAVEVGDGGAGEAEHDLGGQAVAELRVDVVGAEHALGEAGPHVGVLVGAARAAEHRDRRRAARVERGLQPGRRRVERFGPRHLDQLAVLAHHRRPHAIGGVHPLVAVAALVAEPSLVHRLGVDAEQADDAVRGALQRAPAPDRARGARRLDRLEVPRPRPEAVRARGERADGADLHGVAGEVGGERLVGVGDHLRVRAPLAEVDQRIAGDLGREAGAAAALDAALPVEQHEVADRHRLLEVPLLLDEARLAGTERERLVLQRALAAAVAHRAVERVVDQQELEDAVLHRLHVGRLRVDDHAVGRPESRTRSACRACPRPRPGTSGTCRRASCARASRIVGCRSRAPAPP